MNKSSGIVLSDRAVQLADLGMNRSELSGAILDLNTSTLASQPELRDWIEEYIKNELNTVSIDNIAKLQLKLNQVYGIVLPQNISLLSAITAIIIHTILLPNTDTLQSRDSFLQSLEGIIDRTISRIDSIILKNQNSPLGILVGNPSRIEEEININGSISSRKIYGGRLFGKIYLGFHGDYECFVTETPICIPISTPGNPENSVNQKLIKEMLTKQFGKKGDKPIDPQWTGFIVSTKTFVDTSKEYGEIDGAKYLVITVSHDSVHHLSSSYFSNQEILIFLEKFVNLTNHLIAESSKFIDWKGDNKIIVALNQSTVYLTNNSSSNSEDPALQDKFGKLIAHMKDPVHLNDIGGQNGAKEEIGKLIAIIQDQALADDYGARSPTGIIFYGPSGTGKTLLARAIATSVNADVYLIKMTDLVKTAFINEGATNVQELFKYLRSKATKYPDKKLIIIFDELDALFKGRDKSGSSGEDTKIVNTALAEMNDFEGLRNVLMIGTTNRLESVDTAIKRPGRLGLHIKVDLPDLKGREEVFQIHTSLVQKKAKKPDIFDLNDDDYRECAKLSDGFSSAEIAEIIRLSVEKRFYDEIQKKVVPDTKITITDIKFSIERLRHQNGNKNHIFRDLSIPGLETLIEGDRSGSIGEALKRVVIEKLATQMLEKTDSGAVSLPDLMTALEGNKKGGTMGFVPEAPKRTLLQPMPDPGFVG